MESSHAMFEFYWWQIQQQTEVHNIENTQLHEGNQLKEEQPDVCNEEVEERSGLLSLANDDAKKNKAKNLNILKTFIIFHFKKENRRKKLRICCGIQ